MFRDSDDIEDIQAQLLELNIDKDTNVAKKLLRQVLHAASCGNDMLSVFPAVAKLLASNDLTVKKLASWYVSEHGDHPDFILLVINTLLKDSRDPNPMTRGLALKTLTSINLPSVVEYCTQPVNDGLQDSSAYVRRAAVIGCWKIHSLNPDIVEDCGWMDTLYAMLRDNDPVVIVNCISTLEEVLKVEGGMVVNRNIAHHMLNKIHNFSDWHLATVLKALRKYRPRNDEEIFDIMNSIDDCLKSNNATVIMESLQLFLTLVNGMPHLKQEVYGRVKSPINQLIGSGNFELVYVLLEFVEDILSEENADFVAQYKSFYCKYNEPPYLKEKKISMLPRLVTNENAQDILEELNMYTSDAITSVAKCSVKAVAAIARAMPNCLPYSLERLFTLLETHPEEVTDEILVVLQDLNLYQAKDLKQSLEAVKNCLDHTQTDAGQAALVSILGDFGEHLDDSSYLLEDLLLNLDSNSTTVLRISLLTATTKLFLKRPAECQETLGRLMERCMESECVELRDRVCFYYQLLQTDVDEAKKVLSVTMS